MAKSTDLGKLIDAHHDLVRTDRMIRTCDPKIIDVFCNLHIFLDENKDFQQTKDYEDVSKDTQRAREEFIDKCMIKNNTR